jgi:hypothetical protein
MRSSKIFFSLLLMIGTACSRIVQTPPLPTPSNSVSGTRFTIAVEYAVLGVAKNYSDAGVRSAKLQNVFAVWGNIEPQKGQFNWAPLDALVLEYQKAGFNELQMDLSALSPWASSRLPAPGDPGDAFPKPEYLTNYASFVAAVVERYDADGINDMPGLIYPIYEYGIEREFTGFWPGTAEEYVQLLRTAYPAIKAADPQAKVLLVALLMTDVFNGNPTQTQIKERLNQTPLQIRKSATDILTILAACDAYDIVDFHSLGNYTEILLTTAWIRQELNSNGCGEKPIWIGDAFSMSALVGYGGFVPPIPFLPATVENRDAVVAVLKSSADPADANHAAAIKWLYGEMARNIIRKIVVSAGEGLRGINLGNMEDWKTGLPAVDKVSVPLLGTSLFMGMTDTTVTNQKPGGSLPYTGQAWAQARKAGNPRPVYFALELAIEKIGNFTSVQRLELGTGIWAYQFQTPSGTMWVLWFDDGKLYLPDQIEPIVSVTIPVATLKILLTMTPTIQEQTIPQTQFLNAVDGKVTFDLGLTPVFLEEGK